MADDATGTLITFNSGFAAEVTNIDWDGIERAALETTHLRSATTPGAGSGNIAANATKRTYKPSDLSTWGTLRLRLFYDPDKRPPIDAPEEIMAITCPAPPGKTNGATMQGTAFMTAASMAFPLGELMTQEVTLQFSGDLTFTASS